VLLLERHRKVSAPLGQGGFTLIEMLIAMIILLGVAGIVMSGMTQMMFVQGSVANRSEMHSSVRSATELLEQEIGQAGRVSLPPPPSPATNVTMTTGVTVPVGNPPTSFPVTASSTAGMFNGEYLVIDAGAPQETVQISGLSSAGFTATFTNSHASGVPITVQGAFRTGIVPPGMFNGSTGTTLKLYGDINGDGKMVYIEYNCAAGNTAAPGFLYRNVMPVPAEGAAFVKPAVDPSMVVLNDILQNPADLSGNPVNCFTYQTNTAGVDTYVLNVAVTLTVQTPMQDPKTHAYQTETKALLNVSPRNVFQAWELAGANATNRVQPMPSSVTLLLPPN
jgi:prepilin-type N-terminal cleavage/methylation domain-containing protein